MWRRLYLLLVVVRLYFALSPSYLHPDENFQGPELIAGRIFNYPVRLPWEFTSDRPIRSVYPLWPVYGLPMLLLQWVWPTGKNANVDPAVIFRILRCLMFGLSFIFEDWAIHELVQSPRQRRTALILVASSYVTWTFQTHTFSNSVETILVAWSLVLIQRILDNKERASNFSSGLLAFLIVFGVFNRITFPAFLLLPCLPLLPHFRSKPSSLVSALLFGSLSMVLGICLDTNFYAREPVTLSVLLRRPVIAPLNNFLYNLDSKNLAEHGLHPYYQHIVYNLTQLLGPANFVFCHPRITPALLSGLSGVFFLSLFRHQEARFLLPSVPLILSSIQPPREYFKAWAAAWVAYNLFFGVLMGVYHQGGVVPTQLFLAHQHDLARVYWWKTYSPPTWLLDGRSDAVHTHVLMGMPPDRMLEELTSASPCASSAAANRTGTYLVAPRSATFLDRVVAGDDGVGGDGDGDGSLRLQQVWHYRNHLNLDDLDFGEDGLSSTLERVVGRRGLTTWRVSRAC